MLSLAPSFRIQMLALVCLARPRLKMDASDNRNARSFFIGRIFELNFVIVPRSCLFHTFFSHVPRSCLFPRRWYCVKAATPSSMPGDGTGFGISNWILNKYYCNETGKVPGVCEIQVSAPPQNITDMIWNLQPRHVKHLETSSSIIYNACSHHSHWSQSSTAVVLVCMEGCWIFKTPKISHICTKTKKKSRVPFSRPKE